MYNQMRAGIGIMCAVYLLQAGTVFSAGKLDGTPPPQASVVTTSKGILQGIQTGGVYSYKGIPYAKAPVGDLRFAPPQDTEPWDEVRDCTEYGPIAIQYPNSYVVTKNPEQSEDCLTLNIWTPAAPDADERLPVYVFIHGGGFGFGSGNEIRYDGTNFAQNGVIMVTINYRLSTLGFFSSQETYNRYGTTGNWGLLDQIKALEWVRDNIASFGGDPGKVTIGGESAGSVSVSALIVSPRAEGLFRSAIMESGSVLGIPSLAASRGNLQTSIETSLLFAKIFGAADNADGLEQLRLVDADILNYLSPFALSQGPAPQAFFYTPIFDGGTLPKDPAAAIGEGNFNKVNLLVGFNHDESSLFIQDPVDNAYYKTIAARVIGKDWRVYVDHFPVDENNSALQRTRQLFGGTWFVADTKVFGDLVAAHGGKVFMYNYNYVAPGSPLEALGAYHSSELDYVFNSSALRGVKNKKMALEMFTRWVNFIKNADPNIGAPPPTATQWPRYDPEKAEVIIFDNEVTAGPLPDRETVDFIANILPHP